MKQNIAFIFISILINFVPIFAQDSSIQEEDITGEKFRLNLAWGHVFTYLIRR